ncbi:MAG: ParA family protein [Acidobacteria bacterium]|nr:MAG: ParA family protein [Acidobacteriota bacterium]
MIVFATYNIKGGVGKTATAVNLAYLSARDGVRTLLWDLDPQGAASFYFRIRPRVEGAGEDLACGRLPAAELVRATDFEDLDLLPADLSYRHLDLALATTAAPAGQLRSLLEPLEAEYERVFIDCAPSISLVSESLFRAADVLLVPTIPTTLSLRTLEQLEDHLERDGPARPPLLLPFFCMVDRRKALHRVIRARARAASPRFLRSEIPYSSVVEQMGVYRAPVPVFARNSAQARAYEELWLEILSRLPPS